MTDFETRHNNLLRTLMTKGERVPQASWQSQRVITKPGMEYSRELRHVTFRLAIPDTKELLQEQVKPNLPWAEDHFLERVSGQPLNPPPSEAWWPYRVDGNAAHKEGEIFSHTYPERMWSKFANEGQVRPNGRQVFVPHNGIRYEHGDLMDVVDLLSRDIFTRQAYLPIWFPEDTGAVENQRVPCTLGYHFLFRPAYMGGLQGDIVYFIRSCDLLRHFTDDAYMAARLLQWVVGMLQGRGMNCFASSLVMHISSLHTFAGDDHMIATRLRNLDDQEEQYGAPV